MSLTTRVAAHIPYLRRYARAVTGSQTSGDAYVAAVLEALIADLSVYPEASSDRVSLYKLFVTIFGSTHVEIRPMTSPLPGKNGPRLICWPFLRVSDTPSC